ncbi:zinc metalloprotease [Methanogenium organophilum]|uniref:Uncharacterized protein n=1 Tax=Methanogenium organophilum TaxID=2199 RepID=A0A9X9T885_METOG|nr:hypothetical protein [Methanogenium organophilum]WAI01450.1 hypothetical protein OU421_00840 [Methanogenium organophilum]
MEMKKGMRALSVILVLLLVSVIVVPAVSADGNILSMDNQINSGAIFEIPDYTHDLQTNVSSSDKTMESLSNEYGPLNIASTVERYDIVQFREINLKTDQKNLLKVTIYGIEYNMNLERMDFEDIDDGIDSYSGSIDGIDDSIAIFTFDKNLVHGSLQLQDEFLFISPVQNRENSLKTDMPLHVVYSSQDMKQPEKPFKIDSDRLLPPEIALSETDISSFGSESVELTRGWATVYVLVATDDEFIALESNWVSTAQQYMAQAAYQYQRPDIQVFLNVAGYDASKSGILSGDNRLISDPLGLFFDTFEPSYLDGKNADIAIYLGGNDKSGSEQGGSWGYSCYDDPDHPGWHDYCRYAWSQMVADVDTIDLYDGSYHARVFCIIHEIGHIFNADHENTGGYNQACCWFEGVVPKYTVMNSCYYGSNFHTWEYSSLDYHGDSTHDNARAIELVKGDISSLV